MPDSLYDPARFDAMLPANVLGGINRAKQAKRDKWGRMLPKDNTVLPEPVCHGRSGGLKRVGKARRDKLGRFTKS